VAHLSLTGECVAGEIKTFSSIDPQQLSKLPDHLRSLFPCMVVDCPEEGPQSIRSKIMVTKAFAQRLCSELVAG
jgi:hypothetical protein